MIHLDRSSPLFRLLLTLLITTSLTHARVPPILQKTLSHKSYTSGWCGLHVRQVNHPTCHHFNHDDCSRMNVTMTLFDASQTLLANETATLTYDGVNNHSVNSVLPHAVEFTQLAVMDGISTVMGSGDFFNRWPMRMRYGDVEWRNDEKKRCEYGKWENLVDNRDFDCGFAC